MIIGEVVSVPSLVEFEFQQTNGGILVEFGHFVKTKGQTNVTLVGIIIDIRILNPFLNQFPRPKRLPEGHAISSVFPDLVEQYPTVIDVFIIGYISSNNQIIQDIPLRPPNLYQPVELMGDEEIKTFHLLDGDVPTVNYLFRLQHLENQDFAQAAFNRVLTKLQTLFNVDFKELLEQER